MREKACLKDESMNYREIMGCQVMHPEETEMEGMRRAVFRVLFDLREAERKQVSVAFRSDNMYLVGYVCRSKQTVERFVLSDQPLELINNATYLPFGGSYMALGDALTVNLGKSQLEAAIENLGNPSMDKKRQGLLAMVLMLSEGARFQSIFDFIRDRFEVDNLRLTMEQFQMLHEWGKAFKALLASMNHADHDRYTAIAEAVVLKTLGIASEMMYLVKNSTQQNPNSR